MQTLTDHGPIGRIHADDHDETGAHWASMRPVDAYLAGWLENFAAALRLLHGDATACDRELLEIDPDAPSDGREDAERWASEAFLSVRTASWDDESTDPRHICRVEIVTGTGGPHTEIIGQYNDYSRCVRVEAHQYWSGHREAWTEDSRACGIFSDFREAFIYHANG